MSLERSFRKTQKGFLINFKKRPEFQKFGLVYLNGLSEIFYNHF